MSHCRSLARTSLNQLSTETIRGARRDACSRGLRNMKRWKKSGLNPDAAQRER